MYICVVLILICPKRLKRVKPLLKPELPRVFQWQLLGSECWSDKVGGSFSTWQRGIPQSHQQGDQKVQGLGGVLDL